MFVLENWSNYEGKCRERCKTQFNIYGLMIYLHRLIEITLSWFSSGYFRSWYGVNKDTEDPVGKHKPSVRDFPVHTIESSLMWD